MIIYIIHPEIYVILGICLYVSDNLKILYYLSKETVM